MGKRRGYKLSLIFLTYAGKPVRDGSKLSIPPYIYIFRKVRVKKGKKKNQAKLEATTEIHLWKLDFARNVLMNWHSEFFSGSYYHFKTLVLINIFVYQVTKHTEMNAYYGKKIYKWLATFYKHMTIKISMDLWLYITYKTTLSVHKSC